MNDLPNLDPWTYYKEHRDRPFSDFMSNLDVICGPADIRLPVSTITVDPLKIWRYVLDNEKTCQKKWFHPRDFLPVETNKEMQLPLTVGRHQGNTMEYNWGIHGNTNNEIKELIGSVHLENAGFIPDTVLARLIVYMPGHGIPWHRDSLDGWSEKFCYLNPDINSGHCDIGTVQRRLLMVSPWHWGHILQLNNTVISQWNSGDVFCIPLKEWHLSSNQGIVPKVTISLTGVVKE